MKKNLWGNNKILRIRLYLLGKDETSLICFVINCMGQSENEPAELLSNYHINT
jgi:hypothetical protein